MLGSRMASDRSSLPDPDRRVLPFRRGRAGVSAASSPVADLAKYERTEDSDDYRHRMIVNAAAFVFVLALIGAGLWIADTMAQIRKDQDCVLSGRHGCTPVEYNKGRW
jgi:hypothetical protein